MGITAARRRALFAVIIAGLLLASAWLPLNRWNQAGATEEQADARVPTFAEASGGAVGGARPVLSARRLPAALVGPARAEAAADALAPLVAELPASACLSVALDGVEVVEHRVDEPLIGASTLKLVTATALLERLGAEARLTTRWMAEAAPVDGVIEGDLWLVGGGDPLLYTDAYAAEYPRQPQVYTPASRLADALAAAGVTRVNGSVIGDDSRYDDERYVSSWPARYIDQNNTGPLSALSLNDGFDRFEPRLRHATDPARWAAEAAIELLADAGIEVAGAAASGPAPTEAVTVAEVPSLTMAEMVGQLLSESDNSTAELLVKELGLRYQGQGSTEAGVRVLTDVMGELGLPTAGLVVRDGSGLDRGSRVTCRLLRAIIDRSPSEGPLIEGLAVAGRSGTLASRFAEHPARGRLVAKTGFLNNVNGLAGLVEGISGARFTFSLVSNDVPLDSREGFELQERLAALLVDQPRGPDPSLLGP